jgi:hypothetical protein
MAQYSSWVHGVAAQQEADVKQNESVAASSILEFNSTEPTASNPGVLHCSKRFQGKSGGAQRFYFAIPTPNIVLGARANILRVFLMYDFDPGASIDKVLVFDGPNQLIETGVSRVVDGPGFDGVPDPTHDLEEGVNLDAGKYYKRRVEQGRHRDKPRTRREPEAATLFSLPGASIRPCPARGPTLCQEEGFASKRGAS